ncbi:helix-turn-helix domain-containing protein (plasmid) [Rhizobium etli bv. mimosae str. IE4771]|uniref:Helix-turn-helix domain-containing protein n=1 Tax=Rhizobium etli bv. mimosae str. IE4771 TaxID=1432050 RepID=A0A060I919_RHIET|nr:hypothetical protein [Rhizobium sp. IE4771]AIC31458.1 helix-turn-helix domain-containing protein [Rhizobium sp. IE4771]
MRRPFLSLLGGFDCANLAPGSPAATRKARAMVAYLALQTGHSQSREKLAALLWGGVAEEQARANLRQTLSALRRALQTTGRECVRIEGDRITLNIDDADLDVRRFEALAASFSTEELEQAIALYPGELLEGFSLAEEPFEDWLRNAKDCGRSPFPLLRSSSPVTSQGTNRAPAFPRQRVSSASSR